jgi:hypothetical protein
MKHPCNRRWRRWRARAGKRAAWVADQINAISREYALQNCCKIADGFFADSPLFAYMRKNSLELEGEDGDQST